jgi:hypothetical protein
MTHVSAPGQRALPVLAVFAVLLFGGTQAFLQKGFERRFPATRIENLLYLPKGGHLKIMSLGFRSVLADALWVKAIGYFGGHNLTDKEYPWLYHILEQVTTLDPPFRQPYVFGGVVLSVETGSPAQSTALLRKGMVYYPGEWLFPFYIGFNYFYYFRDPAKAATYLQAAATLPGHPEYLPRLAASLLTRAGRLEAAIILLETVAENTEDSGTRQGLYRKIRDLRAGKIPESLKGYLAPKEGSDE